MDEPSKTWVQATSGPAPGTASEAARTGVSTDETQPTPTSGLDSALPSGSTESASTAATSDTTDAASDTCAAPAPGRAPLRRLTRFEYSQTLEALFDDKQNRGQQLPAELLGNGFANDADAQPNSAFLVEQYENIASAVATSALASDEVVNRYAACATDPLSGADAEAECFRTFASAFVPLAYRRPIASGELEELVELQQELRALGDFRSSVSGVVEAVLQSPDFLYRLEFGEPDARGQLRPSGSEMATRLSYFLWGAPPDESLRQAAAQGELRTGEGVLAQAQRLLADPRARKRVQFFFENYLPINALSEQTRDLEQFPEFTAEVGALMYQETWRFLEYEIFTGGGTWNSVLTAPYTFVNEQLARYYGIEGVVGDDFRKVDIDTTQRLGLLTQAAIMTGTTVTNVTNPVRRGGFLLDHLLCVEVPLPPSELAARATPPEPYTGSTGRERYTKHSQDEACASCHALLDPPGFAFENFDAVGRWRERENDVMIDASGNLTLLGAFTGPVELVQLLAASAATHQCFAAQWQTFAYGRHLDSEDACNRAKLNRAFEASGHDIRQLLLDITQTDGFLYLGEKR